MYANYAPDQECIIAYYSVVRYIILYYIHSIVYYHTYYHDDSISEYITTNAYHSFTS